MWCASIPCGVQMCYLHVTTIHIWSHVCVCNIDLVRQLGIQQHAAAVDVPLSTKAPLSNIINIITIYQIYVWQLFFTHVTAFFMFFMNVTLFFTCVTCVTLFHTCNILHTGDNLFHTCNTFFTYVTLFHTCNILHAGFPRCLVPSWCRVPPGAGFPPGAGLHLGISGEPEPGTRTEPGTRREPRPGKNLAWGETWQQKRSSHPGGTQHQKRTRKR